MQIKINNYKIRLFIGHNIAILIIYNNFNRILFKLWGVYNRCDIPSLNILY
jgi:hypothetical protein